MRGLSRSITALLALGVLTPAILAGCAAPAPPSETAPAAAAPAGTPAEKGGQEEYGPYELVANWPQPLPDGPDGVKHEGWTWGSVGAVYAETPYSMLTPSLGNATGNDDGLGATCEPTEKRGWERRYHHVIFVVDRDGKMVDSWPQHDKLFEVRTRRGESFRQADRHRVAA